MGGLSELNEDTTMSSDLDSQAAITEKDVFERLEQLERTVYVPIVPGEVTQWLGAVAEAVKRVEDIACEYFRVVHTDLFEQIADRDPEQNARVQDLDGEDDEICAGLRALVDFADKLHGAGDYVEPDERQIAGATKELSNRAAALVQRIRKHEAEISTWHMEAMLRDRGPVD
jgi:hypothetical protein